MRHRDPQPQPHRERFSVVARHASTTNTLSGLWATRRRQDAEALPTPRCGAGRSKFVTLCRARSRRGSSLRVCVGRRVRDGVRCGGRADAQDVLKCATCWPGSRGSQASRNLEIKAEARVDRGWVVVSISRRFVEALFEAFAPRLVAEIGEVGRDTTNRQVRLAQPSSKVCERHEG
jgi:hypothetical protein